MRMMVALLRAQGWRTPFMLCALLLAGFAEGIGLSALLPLLNIAVRDSASGAAGVLPLKQGGYEQTVYDHLHRLGLEPTIGVMLAIIVLGGAVKSLLMLVADRQVGYMAARTATGLRQELLQAVLKSRWDYFLGTPVGRLSNALTTEAQRVSEAFMNGALMIAFSMQALVYGAVALVVSWRAALVSLAAGVILIAASHFLVRMAHRAGKKQTRRLSSLAAGLTDMLQSVKPLKAMGREYLADAVLAMETSRLCKALRRQVLSKSALAAAQEEMLTLVLAAGIFIALVRLNMPLTTVLVLVVVAGRLLRHFSKVQREYQRMVVNETAYRSLCDAIDRARRSREVTTGRKQPVLREGIRLDNVSFAYGEKQVLDGASLDVPAGSLTALVGRSGSGKTTVIDLITGLLHPQAGRIDIDGTPLQVLDIGAWRRLIGYVPQENLLLHDTVAHNVTLGDASLTEADVERALREADAWDFVAGLPGRLDSTVGERGSRLSGGQRQRIMIARALVHRPRLLILDEATSALDPDSERAILQTLVRLRGRFTILAVSHQSALVEIADRVYRLEEGRVTGASVDMIEVAQPV